LNSGLAAEASAPSERGREAQVTLNFACTREGRTWLSRQRAAYPFHVGRTLAIRSSPERMAMVYLQCCSGGLFENDDVRLQIEAESGALAQVCTSAATIVHSMRSTQARQHVNLTAHPGSHLEYLPESLILFPEAHLISSIDVQLHPGSCVMAGETVLGHDFQGRNRSFDRMQSALTVRSERGALLMRDRWTVSGDQLARRLPGIVGPHRAQGTLFVLHRDGDSESLLEHMHDVLPEHPQLYIGISRLPNRCGVMVRALSGDEPLLRMTLHKLRDAARMLLLPRATVLPIVSANAVVQPAR
jgi:urease accessory protein